MDRKRREGDRAGTRNAGGRPLEDDGPAAEDRDAEEPSSPDEGDSRSSRAETEDDALARLEIEIAELNDRHLRLAAEFENYRKRTREELWESGARAQAVLVGSLLDALDDFQRVTAVDSEDAVAATILEGVRMVERKLHRALAEAGAEMLEPEGKPFDPETMEAVMKVPAESPEEDDTVHQVFQRGVRFKGHLVRPARVAVRKAD
jgi:molecular chaperone GrpE